MINHKSNDYCCIDANTAVGEIGYLLSEVNGIYPITPSSPMAEYADVLSANHTKNIFGSVTKIVEMQSEGGAAGVIHGALASGAYATTYTASQGLLLMIPTMYKLAGEKLPAVFHVAARTLATHALSIFGDHSDVMACRQTGFLMMASNNPQQAYDYALASHLIAMNLSLPIMHFFDGFRTSHEINKIKKLSLDQIKKLLPTKKIQEFRKLSHNPTHPIQSGTAQNPDIFFQNTIASLPNYQQCKLVIPKILSIVSDLTGHQLSCYEYYGDPKPTSLIVSMGSSFDTIKLTIDAYKKQKKHVGAIAVHLYRPFLTDLFIKKIPSTVKKITVLDRTKEQGSAGEPLYLDVVTALKEQHLDHIQVYSGIYGLGSKDFTPAQVNSIYLNMNKDKPINHFTVGINDDLSYTSLPIDHSFTYPTPSHCTECLLYGLGSDGTVSASKNSIKIIGNNTNNFVQGYFEYDSKKSGSLTISHLRFASQSFQMPFLVDHANFISINNYSLVHHYDCLKGIKPHGKILLNTPLSYEQLCRDLPLSFKKHLKEADAQLYIIDANKLALSCGLKNRVNTIMQVCFFYLTNVIDLDLAINQIKHYTQTTYAKKGPVVVNANLKAIEQSLKELHQVDTKKIIATPTNSFTTKLIKNKYFNDFINPINQRLGDNLPVSKFNPKGFVPTATSQYEKRDIATQIPTWDYSKCVQCGLCTMVCPHAATRPYLLNKRETLHKPQTLNTKPAMGMKDTNFVVQCSPLDCTGCELCARICPVHAISMHPINEVKANALTNYNYLQTTELYKPTPFNPYTVKGAQFLKPYFEFSGSCAGCGETPYIRLLTQLFGKYMIIANATGCSSIYGGSAPSCPYTTDRDGHGPSWSNSLFEDNAEYGYGLYLGIKQRRDQAYELLTTLKQQKLSKTINSTITSLINQKDTPSSISLTNKLIQELTTINKAHPSALIKQVLANADLYGKKSIWMIGGDGWAYDIDYGGLDHVLSTGENVNILVLDTEVYSNTGGQSSKATPAGAISKFAESGKITNKKDLGMMAMTYKNVYVAQVALGANPQQLINAFVEAESYHGPSLIIAYGPCINHGIDMSGSIQEEKKAVEAGYWTLYRFDPRKEQPMTIDSATPSIDYIDFLKGEARYTALLNKNPTHAKELFKQAAESAKEKRESYEHVNDSYQNN